MNTENIRKGLDGAVTIAKKGMRFVGPILIAAWYNKSTIQNVVNDIQLSGNIGYDDAVKVITNSSMYSGDKCDAVELLKVGQDTEYYKAVVNVLKSNMYSSDKLDMIKTLNAKIEEGSQE